MAETPNRETRDAMAALDAGKGKRFDSAEKLFEDLGKVFKTPAAMATEARYSTW
jgi:hypothetical protein